MGPGSPIILQMRFRLSNDIPEFAEQDKVLETKSTRHRDYILTDYQPLRDPAGGLHSCSALNYVLRAYGVSQSVWDGLRAVRGYLGADETVWGFKTDIEGNLGLELYFYNTSRNQPSNKKQVTGLSKLLDPFMKIDSRVDESIPYFMCSLDLPMGPEATSANNFHVYVAGERLRDGYDGISYLVDGDLLRLENYYTFYRTKEQLHDVKNRLGASIRSGDNDSQARLMPTRLKRCYSICYATKPRHDALYFSRISTEQLSEALALHFPGPSAALFGQHAEAFGHLCWDIGFDFCLPDPMQQTARIEKVGFYGIL